MYMDSFIATILHILAYRRVEFTIISICVIMIIITSFINQSKSAPVSLHTDSVSKMTHDQKVKVDIEGAVHKPGIYDMLTTQRIDDAIRAAGGVTAQADRDYINRELNRASYLHDQDKIYIPRNGEMPIGPLPSAGVSIQPNSVSINSATVEEIDVVPGIGKTTALKIIQNRPYSSLKELVDKKVITNTTYKKIQKYIHL